MASAMNKVTVVITAASVFAASAAQWQSNGATAAEVEKHTQKLMRRVGGGAEGGVDVHGSEEAHALTVEASGAEEQAVESSEKTDGQSEEGAVSNAADGAEAAEASTEGAETETEATASADTKESVSDESSKGSDDKAGATLLFCNMGNDASPGPPKVEGMSIAMKDQNATIGALGDRLLKAAEDASEAAKSCGNFYSFGDFVWCNKAMPLDSEFAKKNLYGGAYCNSSSASLDQGATTEMYKWMDGSVKSTRELNNGNIEGLSYGIGENDPWSEMMSSMFWLTTRLYDCNNNTKSGPMVDDFRGKHNRDNNPCTDRHCYTVGYEKNLICLADKEETVDGRRYLPLHNAIENRPALSAHIKLDVEGKEWGVLDMLTTNEDDMAAIRSLDVKLNFAGQSSVPLDRRVEIVEELAKKFAVVGSTLEPLFKAVHQDFEHDRTKDATYMRGASVIYTSSGFPLDQFSMSFMNRKLL